MPDLLKKLRTPGSAAALLILAFCLAYGSDAGHGFIKDDFRWVRETRIASTGDLLRLFERSDGFYRPVVSMTFAASSALVGVAPRPYGLTNLMLVIANAVLVALLARQLRLGAGAAVLAAGVWAFNFHGINMAVLWISGRTSLVAAVFAALAAVATLAERRWLAAALCLLAFLSKEETILLPVVIATWTAYGTPGAVRQRMFAAIRTTWPCIVALAVYLALRIQTDAFWPGDAPSYYQPTLSPSTLAANIVQYADRAMTVAALASLATCAVSMHWPRFNETERRAVVFGVTWLVCTFGLTVFVPSRSSLYAVLPSAGSAIASAAVVSAAMRASPQRSATVLAALTVVPFLLLPVYWQRNVRWVRLADLSTAVIEEVRAVAAAHPGTPITIVDNPSERFSLDAAFGNLWPDAAALFLPPDVRTSLTAAPASPSSGIVLRLEHGRLVRER